MRYYSIDRKVLLSSLLVVYWAINQTFNLLFNAPWCPVESDWGYVSSDNNVTLSMSSDNDVTISTGCWLSNLSARRTRLRNTITITTRTQSPMLTINQLARPRSKVNKKKEAVIAVTQTKIMLLLFYSLFALLFIRLLIRWPVPRQSRHVAHDPTSVASRCLRKTNPLSVLLRDPFLCES
jgi:hypothetical protein